MTFSKIIHHNNDQKQNVDNKGNIKVKKLGHYFDQNKFFIDLLFVLYVGSLRAFI